MEAALSGWPVRLEARRGALPLGAIFGGVAVVLALAINLLHLDRLPFSICALKSLTGIPCMTCGGTRVLGLLARFDLVGALAMNPLVTLCALVLLPWFVADLALLLRGRALAVSLAPGAGRLLRNAVLVVVGLDWLYLILVGR